MKLVSLVFLLLSTTLWSQTLQQAKIYTDQNISGWMMSEKLDGIRAIWDGKILKTKKGKILVAPEYFTKSFPPFGLDGELWSKQNEFEKIQSIVLDKTPSKGWKGIKYMVFEVPEASGDFQTRLVKIERYQNKYHQPYLKIIPQYLCENRVALETFLDEVVAHGGEGVMIKDGSKEYFSGRSSAILKVKKTYDMEGRVIGYKEGKGKHRGTVGSLYLELSDGTTFYLGGGLSQELRQNPPKLGSLITFKYYGFTKYGKPKFASFMRVRKE